MSVRIAIIMLALSLTAACGKKQDAAVAETLPPIMYQCDNMQMRATFTKANNVTVLIMGKTYDLGPVKADTGAKYEAPKDAKVPATFWSKGGDATLQIGKNRLLNCTVMKNVPKAAK